MGKLIDRRKQELAKQQRVHRKQRILKEARTCFMRLPFAEITLDSIGQRADVDRGATSMYFRSREELFLLLIKGELDEWYSSLFEMLNDQTTISSDALIGRIAEGVVERPILTRLLSLAPVVLEQNIDAMTVFRFQHWQLKKMTKIGELLEERFRLQQPGEGFRKLHRLQLIAGALHLAAYPTGSAAFNLGDPDFDLFSVDLLKELKNALAG